jgi:hypothetical protein
LPGNADWHLFICTKIRISKSEETVKNEENPRKSRVFRLASFLSTRLGGATRNFGLPQQTECCEPVFGVRLLSGRTGICLKRLIGARPLV